VGIASYDGHSQEHRYGRARPVRKKDGVKGDCFRQQAANQWTECQAEIIDSMEAAEDPASLLQRDKIDPGNFASDHPNAFANAEQKDQNQNQTEPRRESGEERSTTSDGGAGGQRCTGSQTVEHHTAYRHAHESAYGQGRHRLCRDARADVERSCQDRERRNDH